MAAASAAAAAQAAQAREAFSKALAEKQDAVSKAESEQRILRQQHADELRAVQEKRESALERTMSSHVLPESDSFVAATKEFTSQLRAQQIQHSELHSEHAAARAAAESASQRVEVLQEELLAAAEAAVVATEAHEKQRGEAKSEHARAIDEEIEACAEELFSAQEEHEALVSELTTEHHAVVEAANAEATELRAKLQLDRAAAAADKEALLGDLDAQLECLRQSSANGLQAARREHELSLKRTTCTLRRIS